MILFEAGRLFRVFDALRGVAGRAVVAGLISPLMWGATFPVPQRGFEQNIGQYDSDVLFVLGQRIFQQQKMQLSSGLSAEFAGASPLTVVEGKSAVGFPLHDYRGADRQRWRENVPHFSTLRYAQIYSGIDVEWNTGSGVPMVRIFIAPGADPKQFSMRLEGRQELRWTVAPGAIVVWSANFFEFGDLAAYQMVGSTKARVAVRFEQVDERSFRPVADAYDAGLPLVIEFGRALGPDSLYRLVLRPGREDRAVVAGRGFVTEVGEDGTAAYLSLFDGVTPNWLAAGRDGGCTAAGRVFEGEPGEPPIQAGAPRTVRRSGGTDWWIGRFDGVGKLRASTFAGEAVAAVAADAEGGVYFAVAEAVRGWMPGNAEFSFDVPVRDVRSLSTNAAGGLAFAARANPNLPTTAGALKSRFEADWDIYVGKLDRSTGALNMATYVPIVGTVPPFGMTSKPAVALAPDGSLWIATALHSYENGGDAQTLVAVNAGGTQIIHWEALRAYPEIAFDSSGHVLLATSTYWPNLPTVADAPRRAGCLARNLHLRTMTARGVVLDETYLAGTGQILTFEGADRLFVVNEYPAYLAYEVTRVDTKRPAAPEIACVIHTASRQARTILAVGGLSTLVGNQLGPLEPAVAVMDGSGKLPLELGGVQVRIHGAAMPLVSVQQGLITFYIPEDAVYQLGGSERVEVVSRGEIVAGTSVYISEGLDFALLTQEGHGLGLVMAQNEDGSLNGPDNPAKWGSTVTMFGIGRYMEFVSVYMSGIRDPSLYGVLLTSVYAGDVPGLAPGTKQAVFRLPVPAERPAGWVRVAPWQPAYPLPPTIIFVGP